MHQHTPRESLGGIHAQDRSLTRMNPLSNLVTYNSTTKIKTAWPEAVLLLGQLVVVMVVKVSDNLKVLNHASRIPRIPALVVNQLLNKLFLLLPSRSCPPSSTSRNTTARHTDISVFSSQRLLHCTISLASCLYWACSVTSFFSVQLLFKLAYGKQDSVRDV